MIKTDRMTFEIGGMVVPAEKVIEWEYKRLIKAHKLLKKIADCSDDSQFDESAEQKDVEAMQKELLRIKMDIGLDQLQKLLKKRSGLGNMGSVIATRVSRGKRKFSITEIVVPNSELEPHEVMQRITEIMMKNNQVHLAMNLGSNPDHYVLQSITPTIQEVIEVTGGAPLPTHFFAHYGDETGLKSKLTAGYTVQAAGSARLENGTIIGGVRHQVKKEENGFRFKALVEFPSILPKYMIEQHQLHLACEFGHWISDILSD